MIRIASVLSFIFLVTILVSTVGNYYGDIKNHYPLTDQNKEYVAPALPSIKPVASSAGPAQTLASQNSYVKPLPAGPQTYMVSHHQTVVGPLIQKATFDPQDPKVGQTMQITVEITSKHPVTTAAVKIRSDHDLEEWVVLEQTNGSDTDGTWEARVAITDTHLQTFGAEFKLESTQDAWHDAIVFR